jgi:hypothetical protein
MEVKIRINFILPSLVHIYFVQFLVPSGISCLTFLTSAHAVIFSFYFSALKGLLSIRKEKSFAAHV